jgi:signal transduction histidine kinase
LIIERAQNAGVKIVCKFPKKLPLILLDETSFKRIIINLLDNAVKFTNSGGVITVSASVDDLGFEVSVSDTGIGIPISDIERIKKPFEQVHGPMSSEKGGGTGLGLSITKSLMELHDGSLDITSQTGKGTSVVLTFPTSRIR